MENNVADILPCDEQLRTTLHCDDKEKLRMKLVLLQREYLRTAQRLQRAERSEAVRRHVRSRITEQNHQDQRDPEVTSNPCLNPSSLTLNTQSGTASGAVDPENSRRNPVIRFLLPSDAACPQTPDPCHDPARGHKPSPALRLRSRRSRLLWEKRSAEARRSTDNSQEGPEQSESMETASTEENEEGVKTEGSEVVNESEELFSSTESESPSLLLTHWNTCGQTDTGNMEGKETQGGQEQRGKETELRAEGKIESESESLLLTCWNPTEGKGQDCAQNERMKELKGGEVGEKRQTDGRLCEDRNEDTEQNSEEQIESEKSHDNTVEIKEEKNEMVGGEQDVKASGLLDSCTLVEGLLFPVEYYVRTTRRMSSSQSQPDMHAVILSQLSAGRHRRSRGRGRGANRHTHNHKRLDQRSQTNFSCPMPVSPSVGPHMESQSELNSPSSSDISDQTSACQIDTDACFSPSVTVARSARGRRRRRGRGRGRPQTPRCSLGSDTHQLGLEQTSDDPQPTSSPVSSSLSLHGTDGPKPCLTPGEPVPGPDDPQPASTHSSATQPSSGGDKAPFSSASGRQVYPIFLKSSGKTNGSTRTNSGAAGWRSLLLPSTPPAQTSLLPLPYLSPGPLVNNLMNFDIPQDFHLPDDQFASLKLHKLRQVAVESGVEHFTSPSYNTRRSIRRSDTCHTSSEMPLPLPLSVTPTISNSPNTTEAKQTATTSSDLQNLSIEPEKTPEEPFTSCTAAQECDDREAPGESPVEHLNVKSSNECLPHHSAHSQLLLSSPLASAPFSTPHRHSCTLLSSPGLPSLGLTPHPIPLTSSPSAPALTLPPPHSPSIQALSPPPLSPCPSLTSLPPSQPSASPNRQIQASSELSQRVEPAVCLTDSRTQSKSSGRERTEATEEEHIMRCTHTLKAPAGGCLVDACCLLGSSGGLFVAAAGKWAVCLWSQTSASDWSLIHTWAFNEPVINVFPVPDAAGLMCVTLGQLEIREVRMLSCSSLLQLLLCDGLVQAVVGVSRSRVVTSAHSASGSTLQVFTLSDSDSTPSSQRLVSPGVCVGALAPVDGLSDALIGTDEVGRLFIWNLKTGQLLRRIVLRDGLSHTACLRGYSYCGVLFVLLQHQLLSSLEEEEKEATAKAQMFLEEEKKKAALFSLVAVNPLSGKSVQVTRLYAPKAWSGRLCEADTNSCSVVGLSQSGCVCVWELGRPGSRMVWAPESEGWQLARWGGGGTLVTGHHDGDVTLHCYSTRQTPLCH
ncbi:uncharacterized protein palb2 [Symphorus nematophorus]